MEEAAVTRYLQHVMPEAEDVEVENLQRIFGGASRHTWSIDATWREGGVEQRRGLIIRLDPGASVLESNCEVEYRAYRGLAGSGIPAPEALWLELSDEWLGGSFFVMERIENCETALTHITTDSGMQTLGREHFEIGGAISAFDWRDAGWDFLDEPEPDRCWERELDRWHTVVERHRSDTQPIIRASIDWLRRHPPPPPPRIAVVHGDYRMGNVLFDGDGVIHAVLDWEMVHLGDPLEDLAWTCMPNWRQGKADDPGGLMPRQQAYALWEQRSGLRVNPDAFHWWEILSQVKLLAIFMTGGRNFADGKSDDAMMAMMSVRMQSMEDARLLAFLEANDGSA